METVVYIGLMAIVLPGLTMFVFRLAKLQVEINPAVRMEQVSSTIFADLDYDLVSAQSIDITSSTLGSDGSTLIFVDKDGRVIEFSRASDTLTTIGGESISVNRLQMNIDSGGDVWITDKTINVDTWIVEKVEDSGGGLQGLNIDLGMEMFNANATERRSSFRAETTIFLRSNVAEL